ncbi:PAS domain-containing protein [Thioclava sp.]|uniref:PAS domain-containing protein n=1 Tax=Thioclava sp. TaxID=1933450 RepID=UPI003AA84863
MRQDTKVVASEASQTDHTGKTDSPILIQALFKLAALADHEIRSGLDGVLNLLKCEINAETICLFAVAPSKELDLIQQIGIEMRHEATLEAHRLAAKLSSQNRANTCGECVESAAVQSLAAKDAVGNVCVVLTFDVAQQVARQANICDDEIVKILQAISNALHRAPLGEGALRSDLVEAADRVDMGIAFFDANGQISFRNGPFKLFFKEYEGSLETLDGAKETIEKLALKLALPGGESAESSDLGNKRVMISNGRILDLKIRLLPSGTTLVQCVDIGGCPIEKARMRAAIDGAGLGTWEWTLSTGQHKINARWAEMLGYSIDEFDLMTFDRFENLVHPDSLELLKKESEKVQAGEIDTIEAEIQMFHKSGRLVWVKSQGRVAAFDANGVPAIMSGIHMEISDLKLAESRLLNLLEGAHIGTWDWDLITDTQTGNQQWVEMLGYSSSDVGPITYNSWRSLVHPDDIDAVEEGVKRSIAGKTDSLIAEYRMRHQDGHWVWLLDRAKVVSRDRHGRAAFIAGLQIDISEQKAREEALQAAKSDLVRAFNDRNTAEKRLADIAAVSDDLFWEQDSDMRFQFLSHRKFRNMSGENKRELLGSTLQEWLEDRPYERASPNWNNLVAKLEARESFRDFVCEVYSKQSGEHRWLRFNGAPAYNAEGEFLGFRGVGSDITQLYRAKLNAEEASKSKTLFLANMSHEIRTPLNGVLGMAEVLDNTLRDPAKKKMIQTIRNSGESLLNILNDILDMSKIEARKLELELLPFDPTELAMRVEELHQLRADEKGLDFEVSIGMGAQKSRVGDSHRIRQILNNLISNAIKFTDTGEVSVNLKGKPGRPFVIEVSDTGIGMSEKHIAEIHNDFTQADSSITRRFGGTGLGMSITKTLIEMMHGTISIQSELGVGTKITVELPLPVDEGLPVQPKRVEAADMSLKGRHVLIADDNATNCTVLKHLVHQLGATSVVTSNGLEALNAWEEQKFDLLLLDIAMPVMDGKTALQKIREAEASSGRPYTSAIAVTANVMPYQISEYIEAGFDVTIAKPVSAKQICHAAVALLEEV